MNIYDAESLGLGMTYKGRVYNKRILPEVEQHEAVWELLLVMREAGCKVKFVSYGGNVALMLYKYIPLTGGYRLIDRYDEGDVLATMYKAFLDRFAEPDSLGRQENFREALGRRVA